MPNVSDMIHQFLRYFLFPDIKANGKIAVDTVKIAF